MHVTFVVQKQIQDTYVEWVNRYTIQILNNSSHCCLFNHFVPKSEVHFPKTLERGDLKKPLQDIRYQVATNSMQSSLRQKPTKKGGGNGARYVTCTLLIARANKINNNNDVNCTASTMTATRRDTAVQVRGITK